MDVSTVGMDAGLELKDDSPESVQVVPVKDLSGLDNAESGSGGSLDAPAGIGGPHRWRKTVAFSGIRGRSDRKDGQIVQIRLLFRTAARIGLYYSHDRTVLSNDTCPATEQTGQEQGKYEEQSFHDFVACKYIQIFDMQSREGLFF